MDINDRVIAYMILQGLIPSEGYFDITEDLLIKHISAYGVITSKTAGFNKTKEYRFARKLAGKSLLDLLDERGLDSNSGFVYVVSNPAWPEHLKLGMTTNPHKRLASYQTGDPYRSFKIEHYEFVSDRKSVEKYLLNQFDVHIETGEWIKGVKAKHVLAYIDSTHPEMLIALKRKEGYKKVYSTKTYKSFVKGMTNTV